MQINLVDIFNTIVRNNPSISNAEANELAALETLRIVRNQKLAETDWWGVADLTMTDEQIAYRQALRDITDTYSSMDENGFEWPTKPE